jgi:uncharacterized beta-barrel protein YwiB (DUF1934 family)
MTKDVIISIRGLQFIQQEDEVEPVEVVTPGEYYKKNGHHYLLFDETAEDVEGVIHNVIKFQKDSLEVRKKGIINVEMIFRENKKTLSYYQTPFGMMNMGIAATDIRLQEEESQINLLVKYALELNESYVADCMIEMNVKSRQPGNFTLNS